MNLRSETVRAGAAHGSRLLAIGVDSDLAADLRRPTFAVRIDRPVAEQQVTSLDVRKPVNFWVGAVT